MTAHRTKRHTWGMDESTQTALPASPATRGVRFVLILVAVLAGLLLARWFFPPETTVDTTDAASVEAEEVDNPELGVTFTAIGIENPPRTVIVACEGKISVFQALQRVNAVEPAWKFSYLGSDDAPMITKIAGFDSEGSSGRNWLYEVNGELAPLGVAKIMVGPGDHVLWKFEALE